MQQSHHFCLILIISCYIYNVSDAQVIQAHSNSKQNIRTEIQQSVQTVNQNENIADFLDSSISLRNLVGANDNNIDGSVKIDESFNYSPSPQVQANLSAKYPKLVVKYIRNGGNLFETLEDDIVLKILNPLLPGGQIQCGEQSSYSFKPGTSLYFSSLWFPVDGIIDFTLIQKNTFNRDDAIILSFTLGEKGYYNADISTKQYQTGSKISFSWLGWGVSYETQSQEVPLDYRVLLQLTDEMINTDQYALSDNCTYLGSSLSHLKSSYKDTNSTTTNGTTTNGTTTNGTTTNGTTTNGTTTNGTTTNGTTTNGTTTNGTTTNGTTTNGTTTNGTTTNGTTTNGTTNNTNLNSNSGNTNRSTNFSLYLQFVYLASIVITLLLLN